MDPNTRNEIETMIRTYQISRDDLELDLNTRHDTPGEFFLMPLMQFKTEDLEAYLEAAR